MGFLNFLGRADSAAATAPGLADIVAGYSIEVTPRTAEKVDNFRDLLPEGTLVYVAHIEGTPIEDMVRTARRLGDQGMRAMPHITARGMTGLDQFRDWLSRYAGEAGVSRALVLAGGHDRPAGDLTSSMQLLESGLFDRFGFRRLHVAGHPEGNRMLDRDGGYREADAALAWKQDFSRKTDACMAIVTQFLFDADAALDWIARIRGKGVALPVYLGLAGPTKPQALLKYALSCGVGPSVKVLQKRMTDMHRLLTPYTPVEMLSQIAAERARQQDDPLAGVHIFPFGGVRQTTEWMNSLAAGRTAV